MVWFLPIDLSRSRGRGPPQAMALTTATSITATRATTCSSSPGTTPSLMTIFTPPIFCSSRFHLGPRPSNAADTPGAVTASFDFEDPVWYDCQPPEWNSRRCPEVDFSLGLCYRGYATAHTGVITESGAKGRTQGFALCCSR